VKIHGGAPEGFLDFSAPANPLGPPPIAMPILAESLRSLSRYPNPSYSRLVKALADFYGFDEDSVVPLNGAAEAYSLVTLALRPRNIVSVDPTFGDIDDHARAVGATRVSTCMVARGQRWVLDLANLSRALESCRGTCIAIVSIPNNPTGSVELDKAIDEALSRGCLVLADYAFADLSTKRVKVVADDGVIAVFSLTKLLALPGLRIGFAVISDRRIRELIEDARQPWNVNSVAAKFVEILLSRYGSYLREFTELSRNAILRLRRFLVEGLERLGLETFDSAAPYVLARHDRMIDIARCLERKRVSIRLCSSFKCLDSSYARISVRPSNEIDELLKEVSCCLEEL